MSSVLSVEVAAERLGISKFTLRSWIRQRRVEHFKLGRRVVISERAIADLLDRHRVPAREESRR